MEDPLFHALALRHYVMLQHLSLETLGMCALSAHSPMAFSCTLTAETFTEASYLREHLRHAPVPFALWLARILRLSKVSHLCTAPWP